MDLAGLRQDRNIPLNVDNALLSEPEGLTLNDPMTVDPFSNLTRDEALEMLRQLSVEKNQWEQTLRRSNATINSAYTMVAAFKENEKRKEKEHCEKARIKVEALNQNLIEKDKIIDELRKQLSKSVKSSSPGDDQKVEELKNMLAQSEYAASLCKQQVVQLQSQLQMETHEKTRLTDHVQAQNREMAQLREKNEQLVNKHTDSGSVIENLRSLVKDLQTANKTEKEQSATLQQQLTQIRFEYEQMMMEHARLVSSAGQRSQKEENFAAMINDYEQRIDNLTAQLIAAEDAVAVRDNHIQALKHHINDCDKLQVKINEQQQEIDALNCQAVIYRADFDAERKSRENLNDQRLKLTEKVEELEVQLEVFRVGAKLPAPLRPVAGANVLRTAGVVEETPPQLQQLQQRPPAVVNVVRMGSAVEETGDVAAYPEIGYRRPDDQPIQSTGGDFIWHGQAAQIAIAGLGATGGGGRAVQALNATPQPLLSTNAWPPLSENPYPDQNEYKCPICERVFPDPDSLQLHCNDCEAVR